MTIEVLKYTQLNDYIHNHSDACKIILYIYACKEKSCTTSRILSSNFYDFSKLKSEDTWNKSTISK